MAKTESSKSKGPRIGCKNLGLFLLPTYCACCFWLIFVLWRNKAPFRFPPARLMGQLDKFERAAIVHYWMENEGRWPEWIGPFTEAIDVEEEPRLSHVTETGLTVTGYPDMFFEFTDNEFGIGDAKTAPFREGQDFLMPVYEVQLNAYAYLAGLQGKKVTKAALMYFDFEAGQSKISPHERVIDTGIQPALDVITHEVKLAPKKIIPPLIAQAEEIYQLDEPPKSRPGCPDCALLRAGGESIAKIADGRLPLNEVAFDAEKPGVMQLWDYRV